MQWYNGRHLNFAISLLLVQHSRTYLFPKVCFLSRIYGCHNLTLVSKIISTFFVDVKFSQVYCMVYLTNQIFKDKLRWRTTIIDWITNVISVSLMTNRIQMIWEIEPLKCWCHFKLTYHSMLFSHWSLVKFSWTVFLSIRWLSLLRNIKQFVWSLFFICILLAEPHIIPVLIIEILTQSLKSPFFFFIF